jgi:hypothetical protein
LACPKPPKGYWWEVVRSGEGYVPRLCWEDEEKTKKRKPFSRISRVLARRLLDHTPARRERMMMRLILERNPKLALEFGLVKPEHLQLQEPASMPQPTIFVGCA